MPFPEAKIANHGPIIGFLINSRTLANGYS